MYTLNIVNIMYVIALSIPWVKVLINPSLQKLDASLVKEVLQRMSFSFLLSIRKTKIKNESH